MYNNMVMEVTKFTNVSMAQIDCVHCGKSINKQELVYMHYYKTEKDIFICLECAPVVLKEFIDFAKKHVELLL